MRILFLTHYFPPEVNAPASRTYEHCKRWVNAGHDVTVVTCAPNAPEGRLYEGYRNKLLSRELVDGIKVVRLWTYIAPNSGFLKRIINYLTYMNSAVFYVLFSFSKYDRLIATSPQFFVGWAGVILKFIKRKKFILEIRDIWPESILTVGAMKKSFIIKILERMEKRMYKTADHIIAVGEGYKSNIVGKGIDDNKVSVIMNGVSLNLFDGTGQREKTRLRYNATEKFVCSYIGTVGMAHGLEVIINAAKSLESENDISIEFWIVGDGANRKYLEGIAKNLKLSNVKFLGKLPKEDMPDIISASDAALVHLKKTDLFSTVIPSKIFEFMAMNLPIIMGVKGEAQDIVAKANAGEVMEPENHLELLSAIQKIKNNSPDSYNGRSFVKKYYNRDNLAQVMLDKVISL